MSWIDSGKLKSWLRQSADGPKNAAERRSVEGRKKRLESGLS